MEKRVTVLLVDDETDFTMTLSKRLERRGFDVLSASDAPEAFGILDENHVDVVILDVKMPGVDGLQALKAIKANFPAVEVILLTGHAAMGDAIESMYSGAFDFLLKPTPFELLVCKIKDAALSSRLCGNDLPPELSFCKMD